MPKIIIVDDNADDRVLLTKIFETSGYEVRVASNGRDALAYVLQDLPDVILLDILMPEMDGPSFLEVIRSYLRLQSLPVVLYTGLPDSPMIDRARAAKVNSIIVKGRASTDDILGAVREALARIPG